MQTILAVDDERGVRESYRLILSDRYLVLPCENGAEALELLDNHWVDLVLLDLTMPGMSGEDFLQALRERGDVTPVIVVTASNTVRSAIDAMKLGARDYMIKPFDVDGLVLNVGRVLEEERGRRELAVQREAEFQGFDTMVGQSKAYQDALATARQAMLVDSAVLITGESGTGKDMLAHAIHMGGARAQGPFVALSCAAIPQQLFESELFGHERGAFTGADRKRAGKLEAAHGGTLFLDELGEMPLEAQVKLLRVLQDKRFYPVGSTKETEVDIRVICATNSDLMQGIKDGTFRQDLFYRVNVIPVEMPPLRRRKEDIPDLVAHFMALHRPRVNAVTRGITPKAMAKLTWYHWPGNLRELANTVERMLVMYGTEEVITEYHVQLLLPGSNSATGEELEPGGVFAQFEGLPIEEATSKMERHMIRSAMQRSGNVQSRAAQILGTTRRKLKYKMDQLDICSD